VTDLVRFFLVVPPISPLMLRTFAMLVLLAGGIVSLDPSRGAAAVTPVIVLQLFASSSGFAIPARRGHYDLLLTGGEGRLRLAAVHWGFSVAPGIAAWLVVSAIEAVAGGGIRAAAFAGGTWAALFLVSTLPWAIGVALPRFAASIGWLLVLVAAEAAAPGAGADSWLRSAWTMPSPYTAALAFLLYPVSAIGRPLGWTEAVTVAPALGASALAVLAALGWVVRSDFPLEAAQ
jgi:hypothetical protein